MLQNNMKTNNQTDDQKLISFLHTKNEELREVIKLMKSQIDELGKIINEIILELPKTGHETVMNKLQNSKIIPTAEFLQLRNSQKIEQNQKIVDEIIKRATSDIHFEGLISEESSTDIQKNHKLTQRILKNIILDATGKDIKELEN